MRGVVFIAEELQIFAIFFCFCRRRSKQASKREQAIVGFPFALLAIESIAENPADIRQAEKRKTMLNNTYNNHDSLFNDIEAHPITSQTDEFHFVEATQTIGCNWCCSTEDRNKPKVGYDLFLRFISEDFRSPEVLNDFHVFRSSNFNIPVMIIAVNEPSSKHNLTHPNLTNTIT